MIIVPVKDGENIERALKMLTTGVLTSDAKCILALSMLTITCR